MNVTSDGHVVRHDVEHSNHLGKDQDSVSVGFQFTQQLVQQNHLSTVCHDPSKDFVRRVGFDLGPVKQVWVVTFVLREIETSAKMY